VKDAFFFSHLTCAPRTGANFREREQGVHNRVEKSSTTRPTDSDCLFSFHREQTVRRSSSMLPSLLSELRTCCGRDRINPYRATIEHGDQVVVFAWQCFGLRDAKVKANPRPSLARSRAPSMDLSVIVQSQRIADFGMLSPQNGGRTLAAPNIGRARAGLDLAWTPCRARIQELTMFLLQ